VSINSEGQPKIEDRNGGGREGSKSVPRWKDISPTDSSSALEAVAPTYLGPAALQSSYDRFRIRGGR